MTALVDAHSHIGSEAEYALRERMSIVTLLCAGNPDEIVKVALAAERFSNIRPVYGLHPWYTERFSYRDVAAHLKSAVAVGEIGMDSVWSDADLALQRAAFVGQLDIAESMNKPVILHTKGQEEEILRILTPYKMPKLVHWFARPDLLGEYLALGCYFTLGPDLAMNPATQAVAKIAPIARLLLETDGLSALEWAFERPVEIHEIPGILQDNLIYLAQMKRMSPEAVSDALFANLNFFL